MVLNENFYNEQSEINRACFLALRNLILNAGDNITETKKYSMPCFCFKNKMFAYLWLDKKIHEPYILFVEGSYLDFPELETGSRARMKILRIDPTKDLPLITINQILKKAIDIYKKDLK